MRLAVQWARYMDAEKKESFLLSPPLWMTVGWFDKLPPKIKETVWKEPGELDILIEKVLEVTNPTSFAMRVGRKIETFLERRLEDITSVSEKNLKKFKKKMLQIKFSLEEISESLAEGLESALSRTFVLRTL